jgi:hypothetical protein
MKIVIKATHITCGGGLTHLNNIIECFGKLKKDIRFILIGKQGQEKILISAPQNFEYQLHKLPAKGLPVKIWWGHHRLPKLLKDLSCDLLFEPGNYGTLGASCPKITLIHNLAPFDDNVIKQETSYQKIRLNLLRQATLKSIKSSSGIIFLSNFAKEFVLKHLNLPNPKSAVIYHGTPKKISHSYPDKTARK